MGFNLIGIIFKYKEVYKLVTFRLTDEGFKHCQGETKRFSGCISLYVWHDRQLHYSLL